MMLGFQARFEAKIVAREKRHTIRAKRRRRPKPGQPCHCYVNPRQKSMRLLGRWYCVKVQTITIGRGIADRGRPHVWPVVYVDDHKLSIDECERLAVADGFESFQEMMRFWSGRLPFNGDIIHWNPDDPAPAPRRKKVSRKREQPRKSAVLRGSRAAVSKEALGTIAAHQIKTNGTKADKQV